MQLHSLQNANGLHQTSELPDLQRTITLSTGNHRLFNSIWFEMVLTFSHVKPHLLVLPCLLSFICSYKVNLVFSIGLYAHNHCCMVFSLRKFWTRILSQRIYLICQPENELSSRKFRKLKETCLRRSNQ